MYKSKFGNKTNGKKLNIGLQILRTICAFLIIVCHFYGHSKYRIIVIQNTTVKNTLNWKGEIYEFSRTN